MALTSPSTKEITAAFAQENNSRKWEQSYTKPDALVGDDMLAGYGFVEIIGKWGPFISERVRSGIGVWGPHIDYPRHHHEAEEIYVVLAGSAEFDLGDDANRPGEVKSAGEAVFVPSALPHRFWTTAEPLIVLYIWQAGELRQTSTFIR